MPNSALGASAGAYSATVEIMEIFISQQREVLFRRLVLAETPEALVDIRAEARVLDSMLRQLSDTIRVSKAEAKKLHG